MPSTQLEMALWLESDRMMAPFGAAPTQIDVARAVDQEGTRAGPRDIRVRLARCADDRPALWRRASVSRRSLGPMDDWTRDVLDMRAFCAPYYVPNNAVVSLSGDFERPKRERSSSDTSAASSAARRRASRDEAERWPPSTRLALEDPRGADATLRFAWRAVGFADADQLPLVALASVLRAIESGG